MCAGCLSQESSADKKVPAAAAEWLRTVTWPLARGGTPPPPLMHLGFMGSSLYCFFPPSLCRSLGQRTGSISEHMHCSPLLHSPIFHPVWPLLLSSPLCRLFRRGCGWRGGAVNGGNVCRHNVKKKKGIWRTFAWIAQLFQPINLKTFSLIAQMGHNTNH